jgi:hypothetical protein
MTPTDRLWWEQTRAKGRAWFVLREGIIRCVVGFGVAFLLITPVFCILGGILPDLLSLAVGWATATLFMSTLVGTLVGVFLWRQHEKAYQKSTRDDHLV